MTRRRRAVTRYVMVNGRYRKRDERVPCPGCGRKVSIVRLFGTSGLSYANHRGCRMACSPVVDGSDAGGAG